MNTPRTNNLHNSIPMNGTFGVADAYNQMRNHAVILEQELYRLREELEQAKSRIHELMTYSDRVNTELETCKSWQHEAVDREEKVIEELEQAKKAYYDLRESSIGPYERQLAIERKALELACKYVLLSDHTKSLWRIQYDSDIERHFRARAEKENQDGQG